MGCAGSKPADGESTTGGKAQEPWYAKALAATKDGLEKAGESIKSAYDAAKPHAVNAANKTWAATRAAAAAGKEFCIDVADSSKATTQMALLEAQYRSAKKRLNYDKEKFGGDIFAELQSSIGDGTSEAVDGKLVGCLQADSKALEMYREAIAAFKEHEADMEEAKQEIADLKLRIKAAWKENSAEQKKIEAEIKKIEETPDAELPGAEPGVAENTGAAGGGAQQSV